MEPSGDLSVSCLSVLQTTSLFKYLKVRQRRSRHEMDYGLSLNTSSTVASGLIININQWLVVLFWLIVVFILLIIIKKIIQRMAARSQYFDHVIYLVRLPKEKVEAQEREFDVQHLREDIAKGETIFAGIGGLRAQRGIVPWLLGRSDHFSFEVVASHKMISFYVTAPRELGRYLEQQIQAHYPEAVMEEIEDYNIFNPQNEVLAGVLKTRRDFIFPLKTYNKMETDPMNTIINVMSKLNYEDGLAIQYVVRSARAGWHRVAGRIVSEAHKTQSVRNALKQKGLAKVLKWIGDLIKLFKPPKERLNNEIEPLPIRKKLVDSAKYR